MTPRLTPLAFAFALIAPFTLLLGSAQADQPAGQEIDYDVDGEAFTVFGSERYQARADEKSWAAFQGLLDEVL